MLKNPVLYEINTRVWIKRFGKDIKLSEIPDEYFKDLADKGINIVWMMGVWETTPQIIEKCCLSPELVTAYNKSLNKWKREDIIGSPYSINDYQINPDLGSLTDLKLLRDQLSKFQIKLFLDFIPNHFSAASKLIDKKPELFLSGDEELLNYDPVTFFKPGPDKDEIFAHGRDPFFPAWSDTIQLNYYNPETRKFMINKLLNLTEICDGVRCDMSILQLNNIFTNTWSGVLNKLDYPKPKTEFWKEAIAKVKSQNPDFTFIAEAYWDLEFDLQQQGFDYTYDKRLTERLASDDIFGAKTHLDADIIYQEKSVRFLENHDEKRAVSSFGKQKSLAAATIMSTVPGMKFYYDGQFEGKRIKLPLQLGFEPEERKSHTVMNYYNQLLQVIQNDVFKYGVFNKLDPISAGGNNHSFEHFFCWQWTYKRELWIVITNYSETTSQCRIKFDIFLDANKIELFDHLAGISYTRNVDEIKSQGLYVELKGYRSHIFSVK